MRYSVLILFVFLFSCSKEELITPISQTSVTNKDVLGDNYTLQTTDFDINIPNITVNKFGFGSELSQVASCTILYSVNSTRHIISNPSDLTPTPPIHLIYKNNAWVFEGYYPEAKMDLFRNYNSVGNDGTYVIANHGNETDIPRPYGDLFVVKTKGEKLEWTKVSKFKGFYHSAAGGDLNGDGLLDVVGLNMGTYSNWPGNLHTSLQNNNGGFDEARDFLSYDGWTQSSSAGAILIQDLDNDSKPEIIRVTYGAGTDGTKRYSFIIMSYNKTKNIYEFKYSPKELGIFKDSYTGATSLKAFDVDKDNDVDLVITTESLDSYGLQVWTNDGKGNYTPNQTMEWKYSELSFREFEISDVDLDGDVDIMLTPFQSSKLFRINMNGNDPGFGINLQNCILINDNGTFKPYSKPIIIPNIQPGFMKGVMYDSKLHFIGFEDLHKNDPSENRFKLHDVTVKL
jgi:hypothetical protein